MKCHPIQIQFIMPSKSTAREKRSYRYLQRIIRKKDVVNLEFTRCSHSDDTFTARFVFKELPSQDVETSGVEGMAFSVDELCGLEDVVLAAKETLKSPVYPTLRPNQRLYSVMALLNKPVRVQLLCKVCGDELKLRPETIRGALNKNRSVYVSPKHGVWCTIQLAEKLGLQDHRRDER